MNLKPVLVLLLDAPQAGALRARLAPEVGDAHATRLYRVLVSRAITAAGAHGLPVMVWFRPPGARAEMRQWLGDDVDLRPQASGTLGHRLAGAIAAVNHAGGWIAIVRDTPGIDAELLRATIDFLMDAPLVLGPTSDGGCYLIAGRIALPDALRDLGTSGPGTLADIRRALGAANIAWRETAVLPAIESAADARAARLL